MKRYVPIFLLVIGVLLLVTPGGHATGEQDVIETTQNGGINWTQGSVFAIGIGAPPENLYGKPGARPMALRAAKLDAMRNMLEIVQGVRIDSNTVVKDFAVESDVIHTNVEGMVRGAETVKKEYMSDGTVEVTMKMDMNGGFANLVLPPNIKSLEPIKPMTQAITSESGYSGLVVDAKGLNARPAMALKILDENGQEIYGSAFVSREFVVQQGMTGYAKDLQAAQKNPRVGGKPLTVKGLRTEDSAKSNIVISNADASLIRNTADHMSFLRQCRVMIVLD